MSYICPTLRQTWGVLRWTRILLPLCFLSYSSPLPRREGNREEQRTSGQAILTSSGSLTSQSGALSPAKSTLGNLATRLFLMGSDTRQLMPCRTTQGKENLNTFKSFPPLHLEARSNAGDCSVVRHWPCSISFHSSATAGWWGGMDYPDLCKR